MVLSREQDIDGWPGFIDLPLSAKDKLFLLFELVQLRWAWDCFITVANGKKKLSCPSKNKNKKKRNQNKKFDTIQFLIGVFIYLRKFI